MIKTTSFIRQNFLEFFKEKKHKIYPGSSLVLENDPTLLFVNAGMNQFKNIFLGYQFTKNKRISTIQHCIRTGGKHNDLKNVGYTNRHHTFFEMLGNFSFGSYFKEKSIIYAWELLTSKKWFGIDQDRLSVTIYENDIESFHIWKNIIGLSDNKIIKMKDKKNLLYTSKNFWKMGKYGPCGPCTEIFYNYKEKNKKFLEIWNIVFMQYNALPNKIYKKLKTPSVDTGMGLERIASILQGVKSNYKIDIFKNIIKNIKKLNIIKKNNNQSLRVISDHIRSSSFIIANNILPSNENRGYILRKIIRRAILHGRNIGINKCFFYKLVPILIKFMGSENKILIKNKNKIEKILKIEELKFSETLKKGLKILKNEIINIKNNILDGEIVFYLYDTLGFPIDLTKEFCKEKNIIIDKISLKEKIKKQKENSVNKIKTKINGISLPKIKKNIFVGYKNFKKNSLIKLLYVKKKIVSIIKNKEKGQIIIEKTPFYPESGGQIGDSGVIKSKTGKFIVCNTKKYGKFIIHNGYMDYGYIIKNDLITAKINLKKRKLIEKNHTATHLLNSALKKILGKNVIQKGSLINDKKIRFDFTYFKSLTFKKIYKIEKFVNKVIQKNIKIKYNLKKFKEAKNKKFTFLKNKIYKKIVRTISIKSFSKELCKGTHVKKTGKIFLFKIVNEKSISFGIRRIEALTYKKAFSKIKKQEKDIQKIKKIINSNDCYYIKKIKNILIENKKLFKKNKNINKKYIYLISKKISKKVIKINNNYFLLYQFKNEKKNNLKYIIDELQKKFQSIIIILINFSKKINFLIKISKNLTKIIQAKKLLLFMFKKIKGKGGGNIYISEGILYKSNSIKKEIILFKEFIISKLKKL
ncbi:MAG: alanine--tRNA ligase [Buchnera aphidicola (Periphyllus lyropictus)]|uniref:alanine--tRNA ligase n=1 Tax=Buchnera aphidicola TaxID=9 RepID=UPI001ECEFD17|nr:alanine--tRNA ligase [Buchnera aphidicola]NIH16554.1 alanine--tRNA ligase [Buchnera aphidicola (Periphyllus lyropictus)]USS94447.1 alanine--tRNA ligase [Buchnera aphidicola (Periphyllus lyropictus)]